MRCRPPEIARLVRAMDGVAAVEENRMRHWRAAVDSRAVPYRERLRAEGSDRRAITGSGRRDRPGIARAPIDIDIHALAREADLGDDARMSHGRKTEEDTEQGQQKAPSPQLHRYRADHWNPWNVASDFALY